MNRTYKQITAIVILLASAIGVSAQSLSPSVIGTLGGYSTGGSISLSYSMGETFTYTLSGGGYMMAEGFESSTDFAPWFVGGARQSLSVCENSTAVSLDTLLEVNDTDSGQPETWSIVSSSVHGTVVAAYTTTSTDSTLTPSGLTYTPATGYYGFDSFTVQVTDGVDTAYTTIYVTVNPTPAIGPISGADSACQGAAIALSDTTSGGAWSSDNTSVATVDGSGNVTGVSPGVADIYYTVSNSCGTYNTTQYITIDGEPNAGTVSGSEGADFCALDLPMLSTTGSLGGVWSLGDSSIASLYDFGSPAPYLYGFSSGYETVSYTVANSCGNSSTITEFFIEPLPVVAPISPSLSAICVGSTVSLSDADTGGVWSSSNPASASVSATGELYALSADSPAYSIIRYVITNSYGCSASSGFWVNIDATPDAGTITGGTAVCLGSYLTPGVLGATTLGSVVGTWSCSDTGIISMYNAGSITDGFDINAWGSVSPGRDFDGFTLDGGTSYILPGVGYINDLIIAGLDSGSVVITYSVTNSCGTASTTETVNVSGHSNPYVSVSGCSQICAGGTAMLTGYPSGGMWAYDPVGAIYDSVYYSYWNYWNYDYGYFTSSSSGLIAGGFGEGYGYVLSESPIGGAVLYTINNSCGYTTAYFNFNVYDPPVISGYSNVCTGYNITLGASVSGSWDSSSWSSSDTTVAVVNTRTGVVTGISTGYVVISYTVYNSCGTSATSYYEVNVSSPGTFVAPITGSTEVCAGAMIRLNDSTTEGEWSSSDNSIATVDSSGNVTGVGPGTVAISYTITGDCGAYSPVAYINVPASPVAGTISGSSSICEHASTTLSTSGSAGTWSSEDTTIAIINNLGQVTGHHSGTVTIYHTTISDCGFAAPTSYSMDVIS